MIHQIKKNKIIDAFFFYDEMEMLALRLNELDQYVDYFIIMESNLDFQGNEKQLIYLNNKEKFKKWEDKIIHLPLLDFNIDDAGVAFKKYEYPRDVFSIDPKTIFKNEMKFFHLHKLVELCLSLDFYVEDLFLISDIDELPTIKDLNSISSYLVFEPVVLRQKNFIWTSKLIDTTPHMGTCCFLFSNFILKPIDLFNTYFNRANRLSSDFAIIDNGYHFSHFYNLERTINKMILLNNLTIDEDINTLGDKLTNCYQNQLSIISDETERIYDLIEYEGELPLNISLLPRQSIGRNSQKNHLIYLEGNLEEIMNESDFSHICLIKYSSNFLLKNEEDISDKITQYNIHIPPESYYDIDGVTDNLKTFQTVFCCNEIKKIIIDLHPLKNDIITFRKNDKEIKMNWSEIQNSYIYDLIKNIL